MTVSPLNAEGDMLVATTGRHGADIASQRLDALDRLALTQALQADHSPQVGVDLGCGLGVQGLRLALLGVTMHLYDLMDAPPLVVAAQQAGMGTLHHAVCDLRDAAAVRWPAAPIDLVYSQRCLHYLTYAQAQALLEAAVARMATGARLYLSASGLDSELGQGYAHARLPVQRRHAPLAPALADVHGIHVPVCLYRPDELTALLKSVGCRGVSVWCSAFGNIKGVFERTA